jgi:predicted glycogen debranching enzyme
MVNESQPPTLPALDVQLPPDLSMALTHEWLVTNGAGGYAMGTLTGATTRSYHAYLVAAPNAPQERIALVTQFIETVTLADGAQVELGVCENASGGFAPQGYGYLASFVLDGLIPCFTYTLAPGATLEKRIWMEYGLDMTFVRYDYQAEAADNGAGVNLAIEPYCVCRDHHAEQHVTPGSVFDVEPVATVLGGGPNGCVVRARPDALPCYIVGGAARFTLAGRWRMGVERRAERERGLDDVEDVYIPGSFALTLRPGDAATLVICAGEAMPPLPDGATLGGPRHEATVELAFARERVRQRALLDAAAGPQSSLVQRLTLAADEFIVGRRPAPLHTPSAPADPAVTVIAGYPWFTDWGRDTMIALPGLTLASGRFAEARGLLRGFASFMSQGMIPNRFPDGAGAQPEYNTVDATLWLFHALDRYVAASGDWSLIGELFTALDSVISWHVRGTRFGIMVDPIDGLLRAGANGVQLTWMDAKVDDWVVTPRRGKPVEISALWYHAVERMGAWARQLGHNGDDIAVYDALAAQARASFAARFWYADGGYLYDVVDVDDQPGVNDQALRPNQILALAVAPDLVSAEQGRSTLEAARRALLAPLGLRTLAPEDPAYKGHYGGDRRTRDAAYHQGTVWPWLLGAYADTRATFFPEEDAAALRASLLAPLDAHLLAAGSGSISEITSGDAPFTPAGCPFQAWSVAEALRLARAR